MDLKDYIIEEEGTKKKLIDWKWRHVSYLDSLKKPTGGVGHLLTAEEQKLYPEGTVIPDKVVNDWLDKDLIKAKEATKAQMLLLKRTPTKKFEIALTSVNFQLGTSWYKDVKRKNGEIKKGHTKTWNYLMKGNFKEASKEVYDSTWNDQTPDRVEAFSEAIDEYGVGINAQLINKKEKEKTLSLDQVKKVGKKYIPAILVTSQK